MNLERALKAGDRFGGHVVQGHVDGRGTLLRREQKGRDFALTFKCPRAVAAASVLKGSVAVNGVSLTVSGLGDDWLRVDVIPTTASETNLGALRVGDRVNLESDVLGKYHQAAPSRRHRRVLGRSRPRREGAELEGRARHRADVRRHLALAVAESEGVSGTVNS